MSGALCNGGHEVEWYTPRVRRRGCRNYECLEDAQDKATAFATLAAAMATGRYKRGDVLWCQVGYYEPSIVVTMVKR